MPATKVPAEVPISEARALLTTIATAANEHGARTALTRHGKTVALVVPPDAANIPGPDLWQAAMREFDRLKNTADLPLDASRALAALGNLLSTYYGYEGA